MIDLKVTEFKSEKLKNSEEVFVSRAQCSIIEDTVSVDRIETAKLHVGAYDAAKITYKDNSNIDYSDPKNLAGFWIEVRELAGPDMNLTRFNMLTRKSDDDSDCWNEHVYFANSFVKNVTDNSWEILIYLPLKSKRGSDTAGFYDSIVSVSREDITEERSTEYYTSLPPYLVQSIAEKKENLAEDRVFPEQASRTDIGEGTIEYYYKNSLGYDKDYLFTNSDPMYVVKVRGSVPEPMDEYLQFEDLEAKLVNSDTTMSKELQLTSAANSSDTIDVLSIMGSSGEEKYTASMIVHNWEVELKNEEYSAARSSLMNLVEITATLVSKDGSEV